MILSIRLGFSQTISSENHFTGAPDTMILKSTRVKGAGLFRLGAGEATPLDTADYRKNAAVFDFNLVYPDSITNVKVGFQSVYIKPLRYFSADGKDIIQEEMTNSERLIGIISGIKNGTDVFVLDQNHNCNFRDDSVRAVQEMSWGRPDNLLVCNYRINRGGKTFPDSSWVEVGSSDGMLLIGTFQHQVCSITFNDQSYQIAVADDNGSSFCFWHPILAILAENGVARDSLLKRDFLEKGQYLKLGSNYYKFHDFYNGCGTIVLVKENDYAKQVGIQVGLLAPEYHFKTVNGDTLTSAKFKNKKVLIANVSGCTPRSYDIYQELVRTKQDHLIVIGVDSGLKRSLGGIMVNAEERYNEEFYKIFRNAYSSYDTYLIGEDGRVLDRFNIFDWKSNL